MAEHGEDKKPLIWAVLLVLLAIIPIWLIPIAPLTDWPIHLAISSEAYQLTKGLTHPYYSLDFTFLGYSSLNILTIALLNIFPLSLTSQIVLSLLFPITALGWGMFFRILDPPKQSWFVLGLVFNYSIFFYFGMINYLFAVAIGLWWAAVGLDALINHKSKPIEFAVLGVLVLITHMYVFLLLSAVLFGTFVYRRAWLGDGSDALIVAILMLLLSFAGIMGFINPTMPRDLEYLNQVNSCALSKEALTQPTELNVRNFVIKLGLGGLVSAGGALPVYYFRSILGLQEMLWMALLAGIGFFCIVVWPAALENKPLKEIFVKKIKGLGIGFNPFFLAIALVFYLHLLLIPSCADFVCMMGDKSAPLLFAFLFLSIRCEKLVRPVFLLITAIVLINIIFQGRIFLQHAPEQAQIMEKMEMIAAKLPANATVFVIPNVEWNALALKLKTYPVYQSPHYHALLLSMKPTLYVSNEVLHQETFILRSKMRYYDEIVSFGPTPDNFKADILPCFDHPPKEYDWIVEANMSIRPNDQPTIIPASNATSRGLGQKPPWAGG